jgi:hypothetical protein
LGNEFGASSRVNGALGSADSGRHTVNDELKEQTRERIQEWERRIAYALERTYVESERRRFQWEISELRTVRDQLERLSDDQLRVLHERLARDPGEWITQRKAS